MFPAGRSRRIRTIRTQFSDKFSDSFRTNRTRLRRAGCLRPCARTAITSPAVSIFSPKGSLTSGPRPEARGEPLPQGVLRCPKCYGTLVSEGEIIDHGR